MVIEFLVELQGFGLRFFFVEAEAVVALFCFMNWYLGAMLGVSQMFRHILMLPSGMEPG